MVAGGEDVVERTTALVFSSRKTRVMQRAPAAAANMFGVIAMYPAAATRREIRSLSGP